MKKSVDFLIKYVSSPNWRCRIYLKGRTSPKQQHINISDVCIYRTNRKQFCLREHIESKMLGTKLSQKSINFGDISKNNCEIYQKEIIQLIYWSIQEGFDMPKCVQILSLPFLSYAWCPPNPNLAHSVKLQPKPRILGFFDSYSFPILSWIRSFSPHLS